MKVPALRFLFEIFAWIVANVLCVVVATGAVAFLGKEFLGWGPARLSFYVTAMALASLTWGSWAALIWTKSRPLRAGMRGSTITPGIITIAIGGFGAYVGVGALPLWIGVMISGLAMIVVSTGLSKTVGMQASPNRWVGLAVGGLGFPLLTTAVAVGAGGMWYNFVNASFQDDFRSLASVATVMVTILAMALISTVIPSIVSSTLQRLSHYLSSPN